MKEIEFEGRTEREAVALAASELGSESFDVEVLEKNTGIFGRGKVRIRVRPLSEIPDPLASGHTPHSRKKSNASPKDSLPLKEETKIPTIPPPQEILQKTAEFANGIISRMGFFGTVTFKEMSDNKVILEINSENANIIIGKKGKNLDALQLLVNIYFIRLLNDGSSSWRVILDSEDYRNRREETIKNTAQMLADEAVKSQSSRLMEPLNPFERRLIHLLVSQRGDVVSKSEGEGLYKRVRIMSKTASRNLHRRR